MAGPKLSSISLPFAMMKNSASEENDTKKPRRSERISSQTQTTPLKEKLKSYLPSPLTHQESTRSDDYKESTASPPEGRPSQIRHRTPISPPAHYTQGLSSPQSDTQAFSHGKWSMKKAKAYGVTWYPWTRSLVKAWSVGQGQHVRHHIRVRVSVKAPRTARRFKQSTTLMKRSNTKLKNARAGFQRVVISLEDI